MEVARWIADRRPVYIPLRRDLKECSWDAHVAKVEVGEAHVGKVDAILTDSHLDTINRIKRFMLAEVIVPKLEYAEEWDEREDGATAGNTDDSS